MAENSRDIRISRKLSWLLRHGAVSEGFQFVDGCYLNVAEILAHRQFRDFTDADIVRVVEVNSKKRFELRTMEGNRLQIRALQGHSIKVEGLDLVEITPDNCHSYPTVIHGTYNRHWARIAAQGLKRMNRTHIHFAAGEIGEAGVISGLRQTAEVLIYVDLQRALADGFKFFLSRNNVILCEGNQFGTLPSTYFKEVWKLKPYRLLIFADGQPHE